MPRHLDRDFPFTEGEVHRAFALLVPPAEARRNARWLAEATEEAQASERDAEAAYAAGSRDPAEITPWSWHLIDEIYALLACVSAELRERVDVLMERRWREWARTHLRAATLRHGVRTEAELPPDAAAAVRRRIGGWKAAWTRLRRRVEREVARHRE